MLTALLMATCTAGFSSAVGDTPYSARLLASAEIPAATINRAELEAERSRLLAARPGLGFPITMIAVGGSTTMLFTLILLNAVGYYGIGDVGLGVLGVLIAASIGVVVIGVISLVGRLSERKQSAPRLKAIEDKLGPELRPDDDLAPLPPGPPPPPPGPDQGPPGPPPPPPPPLAMMTLATF